MYNSSGQKYRTFIKIIMLTSFYLIFIVEVNVKKKPLSSIHFKSYLKRKIRIEKQIHLTKDKLTHLKISQDEIM